MLRLRAPVLCLVLFLPLTACGDGTGDVDSGARDAGGTTDAGAGDAGSTPTDSGVADSGSVDAGSVDAGADAGSTVDAGAVDGGSDAGTVDGGACGCIDSTLRWRYEGGFVPNRAESRIDVCRDFSYARTVGTGPTTMCEDEVPCAGDEATIGDVNRALADTQVQAALTAAPVLYGRDTRPVDGRVFVIEYRGQEITIGSPCTATIGCTAIPAGVEALKDLLESLQDERLEAPGCASVFPPT